MIPPIRNKDLFDLSTLRQSVNRKLCAMGDLEVDAFRMTERLVSKSGAPCGVHYCLHGPRNVKFTAVIDLTARKLFFYGPDGKRFDEELV
jgi:hypothetical protein